MSVRLGRPLQVLLLLFLVSLAFMQPPIELIGFVSVPGDFIFLVVAVIWGLSLLVWREPLVLDRAYWFIGAYFLTMIISAAAAGAPLSSLPKLLTQMYLLSLPVLCCSLIREENTLRKCVMWWLGGTAVVGIVGVGSLALFAFNPRHPVLEYTGFYLGTLPAGEYPRLRLTFLNGNLACNYLTVSLMLVLAAQRLAWIRGVGLILLLCATIISALATISPGLGGVALAVAVWLWLRERRLWVGRLILAIGLAVSFLFIGAMAVTPILHETAPFLIYVPALDITLAPAARLMIWMDALYNFAATPLFGRGIGAEVVSVEYVTPSGHYQLLTDAHNMFLNIAVQCGSFGLIALLALLVHAARRTGPLRLPTTAAGVVRLATGLGLLNGLVYQGLGGSFEDARHLWVALGILLASDRIERAQASQG